MEINESHLRQQFKSLNDKALLSKYEQGGYGPLPSKLLLDEIESRGLVVDRKTVQTTESVTYDSKTNGFLVTALSFLNGNQPLYHAFWYVYFGLGIPVRLFSSFAGQSGNIVIFSLALVIHVVFLVFCLLSIWKCSKNVKNAVWGYLAKFFVSASFLIFFVTLGGSLG